MKYVFNYVILAMYLLSIILYIVRYAMWKNNNRQLANPEADNAYIREHKAIMQQQQP